jgi:hypothetical protein
LSNVKNHQKKSIEMSIGLFSLSLKALAAQLESLMDESGGEDAVALLDELSKLESPERNALLRAFLTVAQEFVEARTMWNLSDLEEFKDFDGSGTPKIVQNGLSSMGSLQVGKNLSKTDGGKLPLEFAHRSSNDIASKLCDEILRELMPENGGRSKLHVVPGGKGRRKIVKLKPHNHPHPPTPPIKPVA